MNSIRISRFYARDAASRGSEAGRVPACVRLRHTHPATPTRTSRFRSTVTQMPADIRWQAGSSRAEICRQCRSAYISVVARAARQPFSRCYSRCYSSRQGDMPDLAYNENRAEKANRTTQVDLAGGLAGPAGGLSTRSSAETWFALYQAQIGQAHESAKILRGFADTVGKCARMTRVGRIEPCTWLRLGTRSTSFIRSRRRRNRESRPRFREMELIRQRLQLAHKLAGK